MNDETNYPPSGCARCGHREYCHFLGRPRTAADASSSHAYEHPTNEQIKARMLARRAGREAPALPRPDWRTVATLSIDPAPFHAALAAAGRAVAEYLRDAIAPRGGNPMNDRPELDHATARWHETNIAIGEASGHGTPPDPYRYAALLEARAGWFDRLGHLADDQNSTENGDVRDVYAIACSYAAELDRQCAAEVRFQYRIPTLHPGGDAARLGMTGTPGRVCRKCDRPWQLDRYDACPACPDLLWGITPHSAEEAGAYPPGQPWSPHEPWTAGGRLDDEDGGW